MDDKINALTIFISINVMLIAKLAKNTMVIGPITCCAATVVSFSHKIRSWVTRVSPPAGYLVAEEG